MYSAFKNIQYFLSHDDWLDFPLKAVDGKAVPESDGVREEGSLVDLCSGIRYKVVESMASNRADWYEVSGWHVNELVHNPVHHGDLPLLYVPEGSATGVAAT